MPQTLNLGDRIDVIHCSRQERASYFNLFIPVPDGTQTEDIVCSIKPKSLEVTVRTGDGATTQELLAGALHGSVHVDGSYWCLSDHSVEIVDQSNTDADFGLKKGGLFVEVYLDKKAPITIWPDLLADEDDED